MGFPLNSSADQETRMNGGTHKGERFCLFRQRLVFSSGWRVAEQQTELRETQVEDGHSKHEPATRSFRKIIIASTKPSCEWEGVSPFKSNGVLHGSSNQGPCGRKPGEFHAKLTGQGIKWVDIQKKMILVGVVSGAHPRPSRGTRPCRRWRRRFRTQSRGGCPRGARTWAAWPCSPFLCGDARLRRCLQKNWDSNVHVHRRRAFVLPPHEIIPGQSSAHLRNST